MTTNQHYVATKTLEEYLVNRTTGEPLAGGTIEFYQDDDRLVPKDVFQITGAPPNYIFAALPNPMTLSAVGTPQNANGDNVAIYYLPFVSDNDGANEQLYYVVVKDADGNVQFTREGWPDIGDVGGGGGGSAGEGTMVNEISNPQFVDVLFEAALGLTITYSGTSTTTVTIAPDWDIEIAHVGSGSLAIARNNITGSSGTPTNPPYTLTITPGSNITGLKLIQKLDHNPDIWVPALPGVRGFVAGGILLGANSSVTMQYVPSSGTTQNIFTAANTTGALAYFGQTVQLDPGDNTQNAAIGYVDIELILSASQPTTLSSVQIVGLETNEASVAYRQDTVNRQKDYLFHYYNPLLQYKPIPSYLVGWDFPLNPAQFLGDTVAASAIGANKSKYVWDQTIIFQSANSGVGVTRVASGAIRLTAATTTQMAMIQCLPQSVAREILNDVISVHIRALASVAVNATVSLWYTTDVNLPSTIGSNNSLVATLDSNGKPATFNGNWNEVPRSNLGNARFTIGTSATTNFNDYGFNGWDMEGIAACNTATYFAIVIGTASVASSSTIDFGSVGMCAGHIPTRPGAKTINDVMNDCQYYYCSSFNRGQPPATQTGTDNVVNVLCVFYGGFAGNYGALQISFPVQMYQEPVTISYNPVNNNDFAYSVQTASDCMLQNDLNITQNGFLFQTHQGGTDQGNCIFNWSADARLGQ